MERIIVTTGEFFTDIDGFSCVIAYTELLNLRGKNAKALISGPLNASVTEEIVQLSSNYDHTYISRPNDSIILLDTVLLPEKLDPNKVIEVVDHHMRDKDVWKERIGEKAIIEPVGACATLIWEKFKQEEQGNNITQTSAKLLYTAILSNTLDFKSSVTNKRDLDAAEELLKVLDLPNNWTEIYFSGYEKKLLKDVKKAIVDDTKVLKTKLGEKITVGQIELWESRGFIEKNQELISETLKGFGNELWFMTSPSISEGINYVFTKELKVKKNAGTINRCSF